MAAPKLRFKEFVNEICYKELGSLITLMQSGLSRQLKDEDIGLPVLRSNNIQDFRVDYQDIKYWYKNDPQGADTNNYLLKHNDLLVNFINSMAQIGKSAIYNGELGRDAIITTNLMRLQFNNLVIPKFISYYFQTKQYEDYIQSITKPAVNQASFTTKEFQKLKVPYFSIEEQTKVASFLSAVDEKISQLTQKHALLSQYKQGMMQKLFSQQIRFKADDGSEFGEWVKKTIGEIGEVITGKTPSTNNPNAWNGDILFVTPTDMNGNKYQTTTIRTVANSHPKILPQNAIMFTCIASIGKMSLSVKPCITNQQINSVVVKKDQPEFIYYQLLNMVDYIKSTQANTTLPIINKTEFSKFILKIPQYAEQTKIANFLSTIDQKIEVVAQQIEQAKQWKKGLLQQMFV